MNTFLVFYFVLTILVTHCLLSYNQYNIVEFKDKYILVSKDLKQYKDNSLLLVKKDNSYSKNDVILYYDINGNDVTIKSGKIVNVSRNIIVDSDGVIAKKNIIGKTKNTKEYLYIGAIFSLLTSKMGYLLIIILPMFLGFVFEIWAIIKELKRKD